MPKPSLIHWDTAKTTGTPFTRPDGVAAQACHATRESANPIPGSPGNRQLHWDRTPTLSSKCRKRQVGGNSSEKATDQMRTYNMCRVSNRVTCQSSSTSVSLVVSRDVIRLQSQFRGI